MICQIEQDLEFPATHLEIGNLYSGLVISPYVECPLVVNSSAFTKLRVLRLAWEQRVDPATASDDGEESDFHDDVSGLVHFLGKLKDLETLGLTRARSRWNYCYANPMFEIISNVVDIDPSQQPFFPPIRELELYGISLDRANFRAFLRGTRSTLRRLQIDIALDFYSNPMSFEDEWMDWKEEVLKEALPGLIFEGEFFGGRRYGIDWDVSSADDSDNCSDSNDEFSEDQSEESGSDSAEEDERYDFELEGDLTKYADEDDALLSSS